MRGREDNCRDLLFIVRMCFYVENSEPRVDSQLGRGGKKRGFSGSSDGRRRDARLRLGYHTFVGRQRVGQCCQFS
jgi:hypothetical protein